MIVDEISLDIPSNECTYGRPGTNTEAKSAYPQARLLGLVECGTHAVLGAVVSGCDGVLVRIFSARHHKLRKSEIESSVLAARML